MKIIALQAENVKKLVAIEIRPDGNLVQITGKNGQGKTSVLDSIWWALAGTSNIQPVPIRDGEEKAKIRLDLGEITVIRTFKKDKHGEATSSIVVENSLGSRFPSPQKMLDELLGQLSFDPLEFSRMSPKEQFDTLKAFVPGVNFEEIDQQNREDFDLRTGVNRRAKESRAAAAKIKLPADPPKARVDEAGLVDELEQSGKKNAATEADRKERGDLFVEATHLDRDATRFKEEAEALMQKARTAEKEAADIRARLEAMPPQVELIDLSAVREKIAQAHATNELMGAVEARAKHISEADDYDKKSQELTDAIAKRNDDKKAAVAAAKLPVQGITFGEGSILLSGVPFEQAADSEQLKASVAIAMALNPKLRVVRVRDGSLLDEDSMKLLAEMANKADCQIWIERVDGSGKVGFVLEDGHVKPAEVSA